MRRDSIFSWKVKLSITVHILKQGANIKISPPINIICKVKIRTQNQNKIKNTNFYDNLKYSNQKILCFIS